MNKKIIATPYKSGSSNIIRFSSALVADKYPLSMPNFDSNVEQDSLIELANSFLNDTKIPPVLFLDGKDNVFCQDNVFLALIQTFSGQNDSISYSLKECSFKPSDKTDKTLIPADKLFDSRFFLKNYDLFLENGATEDDIEVGGDVANKLLELNVSFVENKNMSDENFLKLVLA